MRRAAKVDANQREIVSALKSIGAKVFYIKEPVDLLVGFRKRNILIEVKNLDGKDLLTKSQRDFFASWNGEAYIVHGVKDALQAVMGKDVLK